MLRLHPFPNHSGGKLCIFASVCAVFHLCRVSTKHLKRQFRTWTKLSHLTRSQTKHQVDSTTQGPILLSTIIYICLIEQKGFFFFVIAQWFGMQHAYLLHHRGERGHERKGREPWTPWRVTAWIWVIYRKGLGLAEKSVDQSLFEKALPLQCWDNKTMITRSWLGSGTSEWEMNSNKPHSVFSGVTVGALRHRAEATSGAKSPHHPLYR